MPDVFRLAKSEGIFVTLLPLNRVLRDTPGWYAGDFHCHTHHSDGALSPPELLEVARQEGLDFFAITDHNTTAAYAGFGAPDDMLILPGLEVTIDHGHFNVFGITHALPWPNPFCPGPTEIKLRETGYRLDELVAQAAAAGLVTSLNHPLLPPWAWVDSDTDLTQVDCVEIWNDPSWPDSRVANPAAVELWTRWLNAGHRITAIGGSDYHRPKPPPGPRPPERLGRPRTVVYAEELSGRAILEGLRRRQVYMTMGPQVTLAGRWRDIQVEMGQDLHELAPVASGALELTATVSEGYRGRAMLLCNGETVAENALEGAATRLRYTAQVDPDVAAWFRLDVHAMDPADEQMLCWAVTNPIFTGAVQTSTLRRYGDFVETPAIHQPADRLEWPRVKPVAQAQPIAPREHAEA